MMGNLVLWNKVYEDNFAEWFFVIVNYKREAEKIEQSILRKLSLNEEPTKRTGRTGDREYRIIVAEANREPSGNFPQEIYQGKMERDPRLYRRQKGMDCMESYVLSILEKT